MGWVVRVLPPEKAQYPLYRRLGGPQGRSGRVWKISPPPGFDPRKVQPVASRYTDWANPAPLHVLSLSVSRQYFSVPTDSKVIFTVRQSLVGQVLISISSIRSHSDTPHPVELLCESDQLVAETSTWQHTALTRENIHSTGGIRTHNTSKRVAADHLATGIGLQCITSLFPSSVIRVVQSKTAFTLKWHQLPVTIERNCWLVKFYRFNN